MKPYTRLIGVLLVLFGLLASPALRAVPAEGQFIAGQVCEAYVSKNRRTNPDKITLEIGGTYPVFEANRAEAPEWYRLRIDSATPQERWVAAECGQAWVTIARPRPASADPACTTPGLADSYVLAASWQPAFCATRGERPECHQPALASNASFTLHGLWPNRRQCGTGYGFCGSQPRLAGSFCRYPSLKLSPVVRERLEAVMPSAAAGSCLQRHEWYKHGSCQLEWGEDGYFTVATGLLEAFNRAGVADFMQRHRGRSVAVARFEQELDRLFGDRAHRRVRLNCEQGRLLEVQIHLPRELRGQGLVELLRAAGEAPGSNCGEAFIVAPAA